MDDFENVHFWGEWSAPGKTRIAQAIDAFEAAAGTLPVPKEAGKPWIAVAHDLPTRGLYYFAKRLRVDVTFTGRTPEALEEAIRSGLDDATHSFLSK